MKILLVEDEQELAKSIVQYVSNENYNIDVSHNYFDAEDKILTHSYECALIDLMLPDGSGFELVKLLKKVQPECGIIIITAKNTIDDKILGFDIGADDYLTKPFHLAELNARLKSLIRRKNYKGNNEIIINEITIDPNKREVMINSNKIDLTKREFDILLFLVTNKERVLTKETIVEHIWGEDSNIFNNFDFVYTHIKNLRKKLLENGCSDYIQSVYGLGYKFSINKKNESIK